MASGRLMRTFTGHSDAVRICYVQSGRKVCLSGSADKTVKLWETASGREIRTFKGHSGMLTSVVFSPDGRHAFQEVGMKP